MYVCELSGEVPLGTRPRSNKHCLLADALK